MNNSIINFNGEFSDLVLANYHLGNGYRDYNPAIMQFSSPDDAMSPFGKGGINPYIYCSGDPINNTDPTGHFNLNLGGALGIGGAIVGTILVVSAIATSAGLASIAIPALATLLATSATGTGIWAENTTSPKLSQTLKYTSDVLAAASIVTDVLGGIVIGVKPIAEMGLEATNSTTKPFKGVMGRVTNILNINEFDNPLYQATVKTSRFIRDTIGHNDWSAFDAADRDIAHMQSSDIDRVANNTDTSTLDIQSTESFSSPIAGRVEQRSAIVDTVQRYRIRHGLQVRSRQVSEVSWAAVNPESVLIPNLPATSFGGNIEQQQQYLKNLSR